MIPRRNWSRIFLVTLLFFVTLGMSSCLDVHTFLKVDSNGGVTAEISYTLDKEIADYGRGFGSDEPWPFPLTERDFRQKTLMVEGTLLKKYRTRTGEDGREIITVTIVSDSAEAMGECIGIPLSIESEGNSGSLTILFPQDSRYAQASAESREAVDALVSDSTVSFTIQTPSKPLDAGTGTIDRRQAEITFRLDDLLYGRGPANWTVSW